MSDQTFTGTLPRKVIAEALAELLDDTKFLVVGYEDTADRTDRFVVVTKQRTLANAPEAPAGVYATGLIITVIADRDGSTEGMEDALDGAVIDVWEALMSMRSVLPDKATKVNVNESRIGYDIETNLLTPKG